MGFWKQSLDARRPAAIGWSASFPGRGDSELHVLDRAHVPTPTAGANGIFERPRPHEKFLYVGNRKFYVRGTTYGAFPFNREGDQFPEPGDTARDFALMREAGINTILTYTVPPRWLLDAA